MENAGKLTARKKPTKYLTPYSMDTGILCSGKAAGAWSWS